ncbi:MAG: FAD-dependent oxidoreductase [Planctomycetes bacterium]|nr:FAD-dependent oxidoreductase [Planctomycetota bacterium]
MSKDKRPAIFHSRQEIGRGTYIMSFVAQDELALDYEPGHVFGLECTDDRGNDFHHAYTVIACDSETRVFSFTFRHILDGNLTPYLLRMESGSEIVFSGKGHKPIREDVNQTATQVIGVGTGSGVGPLYGYISKHIQDIKVPHRFYFGYRETEDICLQNELDQLSAQQPLFTWQACLSQPNEQWTGLSGQVHLAATKAISFDKTTHVHMVGNGQMITELRAALIRVNLPTDFISKESFFKHGEVVRDNIVSELKTLITTK